MKYEYSKLDMICIINMEFDSFTRMKIEIVGKNTSKIAVAQAKHIKKIR